MCCYIEIRILITLKTSKYTILMYTQLALILRNTINNILYPCSLSFTIIITSDLDPSFQTCQSSFPTIPLLSSSTQTAAHPGSHHFFYQVFSSNVLLTYTSLPPARDLSYSDLHFSFRFLFVYQDASSSIFGSNIYDKLRSPNQSWHDLTVVPKRIICK